MLTMTSGTTGSPVVDAHHENASLVLTHSSGVHCNQSPHNNFALSGRSAHFIQSCFRIAQSSQTSTLIQFSARCSRTTDSCCRTPGLCRSGRICPARPNLLFAFLSLSRPDDQPPLTDHPRISIVLTDTPSVPYLHLSCFRPSSEPALTNPERER